MKQLSLFAIAVSVAGLAQAADPSYKVDSDLNYMINKTAAASTTSLSGHALASRTVGVWTQEYAAEAVGSSSSAAGTPNTERYLASGKLSSEVQPNTTVFGKLQAEKDRASAFDYNAALTVGLGHVFIKDNLQNLTGEIGVGNRFFRQTGNSMDTEVLATIGGHYDRKLTPTLTFIQDLAYEYGKSLDTLRSRTSLAAAISSNLAAIASYEIKSDHSSSTTPNRINNQLTTFGIKYKY